MTFTLFPAAVGLTEAILPPCLTFWPVSAKLHTREEASKVTNFLEASLKMGGQEDGRSDSCMFVSSF